MQRVHQTDERRHPTSLSRVGDDAQFGKPASANGAAAQNTGQNVQDTQNTYPRRRIRNWATNGPNGQLWAARSDRRVNNYYRPVDIDAMRKYFDERESSPLFDSAFLLFVVFLIGLFIYKLRQWRDFYRGDDDEDDDDDDDDDDNYNTGTRNRQKWD